MIFMFELPDDCMNEGVAMTLLRKNVLWELASDSRITPGTLVELDKALKPKPTKRTNGAKHPKE